MKKQDKESLIREVTKRLDWYTMEASDEEFDADEVQTLLKLLDSLKGEEKEEELPVEEALDSFWKYCEKRQEEERILAADGKKSEENRKTKPEKKEGRMHQFLWYFHKHRIAVVTAVALIIIMLGGSWQMAVNAEKHGGFFWWMDKNEEGTTMITAPEGGSSRDSEKGTVDIYYSIDKVPEKYKEYAIMPKQIESVIDYNLELIEITKLEDSDTIYELFQNKENAQLRFWIKIYPQQMLRVRESYPGFIFLEEFEEDGVEFNVFQKQEKNKTSYIMYFYYSNEKYMVGGNDKDFLKSLAIEYKDVVKDFMKE